MPGSNPLQIQLSIAQLCIIAMKEKYGEQHTLQLLEQMKGTMDAHHAAMLSSLVNAMSLAAMNTVSAAVH